MVRMNQIRLALDLLFTQEAYELENAVAELLQDYLDLCADYRELQDQLAMMHTLATDSYMRH